MHRRLPLIVAACTLFAASLAHAGDDADLHKRSAELQAAESRFDADASAAFWANDGVGQMHGAPKFEGRQAILEAYKGWFTQSGIKVFNGTPTHLEISGDLAWETGVNHMVFATPNGDVEDTGKYLLVWKRVDGQWYVAAVSANSDAPTPKPVAKPAATAATPKPEAAAR